LERWKKLPPPTLCRWGHEREKINERATNSPTDLSCKPDANKKPPLRNHSRNSVGAIGDSGLR
jgi:hypothetical protein